MTRPYVTVPLPDAPPSTDTGTGTTDAADPITMILTEQIRDQLWMAAATSPRSLQQSIGASEIGSDCELQIGYKVAGTRACNFPDPLRTMAGTGMHMALEDAYTRIDGGSGRFLIEEKLSYRGIMGTSDLTDRRRHVVVDWKTSTKAKIRDHKRNGPPRKYVVQAEVYACALREQGEQIDRIALVFIPLDGTLDDIFVWTAPVDAARADEWIERYERIAAQAQTEDGLMGLPSTPSRLCPWCSHHRPGSADLTTGCPGQTTPNTTTKGTP